MSLKLLDALLDAGIVDIVAEAILNCNHQDCFVDICDCPCHNEDVRDAWQQSTSKKFGDEPNFAIWYLLLRDLDEVTVERGADT